MSTTKMPSDDGAEAHTIHVLVNIRDKMEAERRYRDLFDSIQEGAFFCEPGGRMVDANDALVLMLGCEPDAPISSVLENLSPEDRARVDTLVASRQAEWAAEEVEAAEVGCGRISLRCASMTF